MRLQNGALIFTATTPVPRTTPAWQFTDWFGTTPSRCPRSWRSYRGEEVYNPFDSTSWKSVAVSAMKVAIPSRVDVGFHSFDVLHDLAAPN